MRRADPIKLGEALAGFQGKWVALVDWRVIESADTPYDLYRRLHEKQIRGTTILRVPAEDEPEIVGLG